MAALPDSESLPLAKKELPGKRGPGWVIKQEGPLAFDQPMGNFRVGQETKSYSF